MTNKEIASQLFKAYKEEGKDANQGGLSKVSPIQNPEYDGLLVGFYLNARVAVNPQSGELVRFDIM